MQHACREWGSCRPSAPVHDGKTSRLPKSAPIGHNGTVALRILLVDDDTAHLDALSEFITVRYADQYVVETAAGGREAVEIVLGAKPDLVILDVGMPGMNGLEVLRIIRAADPNLPVIMLTGNDDARIAGETLKIGIVAYCPKPVNFQYLEHLIATALDPPAAPKTRRGA
jgi:YesN/AraC family two-component response regulator